MGSSTLLSFHRIRRGPVEMGDFGSSPTDPANPQSEERNLMYAVPDVDEVVAVAKELGIHLGPDEAVKYRKYLIEQLDQLDTFVQARLEEPKPPMVSEAISDSLLRGASTSAWEAHILLMAATIEAG